MIDLKAAFAAERDMRQRNYDLAISRAVDLLEGYRHRAPSTHVGHNLSNVAHELTEAAAQFQAAETALRTLTAD